MSQRVGILPLGRNTFDVEFAEDMLSGMLEAIDEAGIETVGPRQLLFDSMAANAAISKLKQEEPDRLLILQVTFTDASATLDAAAALDVPLGIWAVPEPRLGGRLRLNAFCGLNLASHALSRRGRNFSWMYCDPKLASARDDLAAMLAGKRETARLDAGPVQGGADDGGRVVAEAIRGRRIARLGERPTGFDTCRYDRSALRELAGVEVEEFRISDLFDRARQTDDIAADGMRRSLTRQLSGIADVDQEQLLRSLKLKTALNVMQAEGNFDAFAIRCWPETFTEYGGAVCGPVAMLGEKRVPCACEADVYGALTQLILQEVAAAPVFLTDLVDVDAADDTSVVWHCGQAPISMADPEVAPEATIHTNRKMPLLYQFPLKPGRVTFMRVSQAWGEPKLIIAQGEMLKRPMAFTGTSGVVRFSTDARTLLPKMMNAGLEHHMALAYGDHVQALRGVAAAMNLPVLEL